MEILGIVTMPLGLDAEFWRQIGYGMEWIVRSNWVVGKWNKLMSAIGPKRSRVRFRG